MYDRRGWLVETIVHCTVRADSERVFRGEAVVLRSAAACDRSTAGRAYLQRRIGKCLIAEKKASSSLS
jgi:hypothetical protein